MPVIKQRIPWTKQPQVARGVDWGNPLSRGLVGCIRPELKRSLIGGVIPTSTNFATASGMGGIGRFFSSEVADGESYLDAALQINSLTLLCLFELTAVPAGTVRLVGDFISTTYGYALLPNNTNIRYGTARSGANSIISGSSSVAGRVYCAVGVTDATNNTLYENGVITAGPTAHGGVAAPGGANPFTIGRDASGNSAARSKIYLTLVWNRPLSSSEVKAISDAPWQIFAP